jgi:hypothetical protein
LNFPESFSYLGCVMTDHEAKLINQMVGQADPLADAAVAAYQTASPDVRMLFEQGMRQGVHTINAVPESLRAFLADAESSLAQMHPAAIEEACEPYAWIGPLWLSMSLGPGALVHTYCDPDIAAVLMRTGNLTLQTVSRRLLETQLWLIGVIKPAGLRVGGSGYIQTLQVRLLHARVRATLLQRGWQGADPRGKAAVPIDQVQMLRTWLDFTVVSLTALERIGLGFSHEQQIRIYEVWRLVGHLLGMDAMLLAQITEHESAKQCLQVVDARLRPPDDNSRQLTHAMITAMGDRVAPVLGLPADVSTLLMTSLCRLFHGEKLSEHLGLSANWTASLLPMMADANRYRFERAVRDPSYREQLRQHTLQAFASIEAGISTATVYQAMSTSLVADRLPEVRG